jgi:molybdenum cofactor biosynthesis protein B
MGHLEHKEKAPTRVGCAVITVSDTRTPENDSSGALIQEHLKREGHRVTGYRIIKDSTVSIKETLLTYLNDKGTEAILFTGGTGISRHDSTYEVVKTLLEKEIDGFGELFRFLSYQSIGTSAMLSRSTAGVCQGKIIISLPGSEEAVRLAMTALVLPELPHMIYLVR